MRWAWLACLFGCGRLGFDPVAGNGTHDGSPVGDDGRRSGANLAFVSRLSTTGGFGGLAGGDAICANAAAAAGWSGTFRAWLSDANTAARDRFPNSRGWVRVDGAPVGDTIIDMIDGHRMFHPIDRDEYGAVVEERVWSGGEGFGRIGAARCADWTIGMIGTLGSAGPPTAAWPLLETGGNYGCHAMHHLLCLEVGRNVAVAPEPANGRLLFLSVGSRSQSAQLVPQMDALCQSEATAAQLAGTFRAAVATTTTPIPMRFALDARPWTRHDGTIVAHDGAALFSGAPLDAFANQTANGTYVGAALFISGSTRVDLPGDLNCADWSGFNNGSIVVAGNALDVAGDGFWYSYSPPCNASSQPLLCLQD